MDPHIATKASLELLQLERLLRREPQGINPSHQKEARHYFSKTEEYLEGESLLLGKLQHAWPLVERCFIGDVAEVPQPALEADSDNKSATGRALDALREIQQNLAVALGRQAATGL